jgi:hypothetical protein
MFPGIVEPRDSSRLTTIHCNRIEPLELRKPAIWLAGFVVSGFLSAGFSWRAGAAFSTNPTCDPKIRRPVFSG